MFHVGKKESFKEVLNKDYSHKKTLEMSEYEKTVIEKIIVTESVNPDTGVNESFGVIAGIAFKNGATHKVWFYIPGVDNAGIVKSSSEEDRNLIESGNYIYIVEKKRSEKGRDYAVGTLEED